MAIKLFLRVPGIPGDSTDRFHAGEIELKSSSWGTTLAVGTRPTFVPLGVTKLLDTASPQLEQAAVTRRSFPTMVLSVQRLGEEPFDIAVYTFTNASITGFSQKAPVEGFVEESLTIEYGNAQFTVMLPSV